MKELVRREELWGWLLLHYSEKGKAGEVRLKNDVSARLERLIAAAAVD